MADAYRIPRGRESYRISELPRAGKLPYPKLFWELPYYARGGRMPES